MNDGLTSPDGTPITIRPIAPGELEGIPLRCWPDRDTIECLLAEQGTIGMAAWEADRCVGQLHCYRVGLPEGTSERWPGWSRWWKPELYSRAGGGAGIEGPGWFHACCHVGRTLESLREELLSLILAFAPENDWDAARTCSALNELDAVNLTQDAVKSSIEELRRTGRTDFRTLETQYHGRGIGTALCRESVRWARQHGYAAVLARGGPEGLFEFARWWGILPFTTYARMGFKSVALEQEGGRLPDWALGDSPPEVMAEVRAALGAGRPAHEFHHRLMVLDLSGPPA